MSDPGHAVFLSYASQDVVAANRIAAALRDAGVEVWLDQSELTGGDQWDAKIRGQVASCALFIPVISAATQARLEGYFRIEWKLAAQRTHAMAEAKAFLLPVAIDATRDSDAHVPAEFKSVQWTRLPGGDTSDVFCARVKKLLGNPSVAGVASTSHTAIKVAVPDSVPASTKPARARPWLVPALIGLAALGALAIWQPWKSRPSPAATTAANPAVAFTSGKSIAVLAFADLSADKGSEYFADGVSEELLDVLGKVPDLRVVGRTSSFSFKGKNAPAAEIAHKLGVAYLVDGSVARDGTKVRIAARLINASDGFQLWSDKFTRELTDIFKLQDEIAGLIAKNLSLKLGTSTPAKSVNPEVFRLYLEGRQEWNKRTAAGNSQAETLFNRAIALDPAFARAHAGLADVYYIRGQGIERNSAERETIEKRADEHIERALALDPNLAEPYATRAMLFRTRRSDRETDEAFQRALAINPNYATAHQWYGSTLGQRGKFPAALAELEIALRLDPMAPAIWSIHGAILRSVRRWPEALASSDRALALQPDFERAQVERILPLIQLNRRTEALALAYSWAERNSSLGNFGRLSAIIGLAMGGEIAAAEKFAAPYLTNPGTFRIEGLIQACLALGRTDDAFALLTQGTLVRTGSGTPYTHPVFDAIRDDPRFLRSLEKAGMLAEYREAWSHVPEAEKKKSAKK